jgi:hypothetical protein
MTSSLRAASKVVRLSAGAHFFEDPVIPNSNNRFTGYQNARNNNAALVEPTEEAPV